MTTATGSLPEPAAAGQARVPPPHEQLRLVREKVRAARLRPPDPVAGQLPVARVAVAVNLAHLDRPFDYLVPESLSALAVPGARVRVRFAGRELDGFVTERLDASEHGGALEPLRRVVSPEPVLHPEVLTLARAVAQRYAGPLADVLRLAVPPRHAGAELAPAAGDAQEGAAPALVPAPPAPLPPAVVGSLARYDGGAELQAALASGGSPRAVWAVLPGSDPGWAAEIAALVLATAAGGRGALVVAPDQRDVDVLDVALSAALGPGRHVSLTAGLGPAERYRRFLAVSRGEVNVVLGTRAAVFAPVRDLGLVLVWDDGDDSLAEQRSPYPHAREVCLLRATTGAPTPALVLAGVAVSAEGALLVSSGWARAVRADRRTIRATAPRVLTPEGARGSSDPLAVAARLPEAAWRTAQAALERGPVLVQVPRVGYVPSLACGRCRQLARCRHCEGPLALQGGTGDAGGPAGPAAMPPRCSWCGRDALGWECRHCGDRRLRAVTVGAARTAEELGRAFPRVRVLQSSGERRRTTVPDRPALVVATPGAEPVAEGGYAAALLLDAAALLTRPALRAQEEAFRRWIRAASLVRAAGEGGSVVLVGDPALAVVQALVRWDPFGAAAAELADRGPLALPPTARVALLTGPPGAVTDAVGELRRRLVEAGATDGVRIGAVLEEVAGGAPPAATGRRDSRAGTRPAGRSAATPARTRDAVASGEGEAAVAEPQARVLVRAAHAHAATLSRALLAMQAVRSAHRDTPAVRVRIDPVDLS